MDILRAPWRMEYIDSISSASFENKNRTCIFCEYPTENKDDENLIIARGSFSFVILNRYPYSVGHILIAPYRHTAIFPSLSEEEKLEIFSFSQKSVALLEKLMNSDGFNIGMNLGRAAGSGIDAHLHLHVVPRWNGDINFMSVTSETKVLPEALCVTRRKILAEWKKWDTP